MAKGGDLWDDSVLTSAFDQAMSKYKKMHIKGYEESSVGSGEAKAKEMILDDPSSIEVDGDSSQMLKAVEVKADNLPFAKENETLDSQVPQEYVQVPNGIPLQDHTQRYSSSQGQEEYDLLCNQYYELEEKRVQIWEKLQQYGHSDYSYPRGTSGSCMQWPTAAASQDQYYSNQACYPAVAITCCPNICPSSTTSCSLATCSLGNPGPSTNSPLTTGNERMSEDVDIVKKGMEAAQKAISMLKEEASDCQLEVPSCRQREPNSNGETDLTEVLNAWYSAGFYTGKYLTEKSLSLLNDASMATGEHFVAPDIGIRRRLHVPSTPTRPTPLDNDGEREETAENDTYGPTQLEGELADNLNLSQLSENVNISPVENDSTPNQPKKHKRLRSKQDEALDIQRNIKSHLDEYMSIVRSFSLLGQSASCQLQNPGVPSVEEVSEDLHRLADLGIFQSGSTLFGFALNRIMDENNRRLYKTVKKDEDKKAFFQVQYDLQMNKGS